MMMAEALQECLPRFPKVETEQRQALEAFISGRNMIAILMLKASPY